MSLLCVIINEKKKKNYKGLYDFEVKSIYINQAIIYTIFNLNKVSYTMVQNQDEIRLSQEKEKR